MSKEALSQAEIDALLRSLHDDTPIAPVLSDADRSALSLFGDTLFGPGAAVLTDVIAAETTITAVRVHATSVRALGDEVPGRNLVAAFAVSGAMTGTAHLIVEESAMATAASRAAGLPGSAEIGERQLASAAGLLRQIAAAGSPALSERCGQTRVTVGELTVKDLGVEPLTGESLPDDELLAVALRWQVSDLIDSQMLVVLDRAFADQVIAACTPVKPVARAARAAAPAIPTAPAALPPETQAKQAAAASARHTKAAPPVTVQRAEFSELPRGNGPDSAGNIDLLLDVPLGLTVELGRTKKTIREILSLGPGSVVELDKLAGETVDILVGGKLIAKGEVVVIDENFAVRITDIISPMDRLNSLR